MIHLQKIHFRNCCLKIAPSKKNDFQSSFLKNYIFEVSLSKDTFSKLLPQKIYLQKLHFQNYSFKKCIFRTTVSKNTNLIALLYFSSESWEELSKLSIIYLITFFFMYLHYFIITCRR